MLDVHVPSCSRPLPLLLLLGDCSSSTSGCRWTSKFATSCASHPPAGNATNPTSCYSSCSSCNSTSPSCNSSCSSCNSSNHTSSIYNCYSCYSSRRSTSSRSKCCSRSGSFHRSSSCPNWSDKQAKNERCHSRRRHRLRDLHRDCLNFLPLQLHKKIEEDAVSKTADDLKRFGFNVSITSHRRVAVCCRLSRSRHTW